MNSSSIMHHRLTYKGPCKHLTMSQINQNKYICNHKIDCIENIYSISENVLSILLGKKVTAVNNCGFSCNLATKQSIYNTALLSTNI